MRKTLLLVVVLGLAVAVPAVAATLTGRVKSINGSTFQMTPSAPETQSGADLSFTADNGTRLVGLASLGDLRVGDKVSVRADRSDGVWKVREIERNGPASTAASNDAQALVAPGPPDTASPSGSTGAAPAAETKASQQGNPNLQ